MLRAFRLLAIWMVILTTAVVLHLYPIADFQTMSMKMMRPVMDAKSFVFSQRERFTDDIDDGRLVNSDGVPVRVVVLVASTARSGSSFIGELLSQQDNELYIFEPLYYALKQAEHNITVNTTQLLEDMIYCRISQGFARWLRRLKKTDFIFRNYQTNPLRCKRKSRCLTVSKLTEMCQGSSNRIIKVIRMRMNSMRTLLDDPYVDLKVINLVRDPRPALFSRTRIFKSKLLADSQCKNLEEDLLSTPQLMKEYPDRVMGITYEDFSVDPIGKATEMWQFISENRTASLPPSWSEYLARHMRVAKGSQADGYSTYRNTSTQYQAWRHRISAKALYEIEKYCQPVLKLLGYNLFNTIENVRNLSYPLFVENRIPYPNT